MATCKKCGDTGWGYSPFYGTGGKPCTVPACVANRAAAAAEAAEREAAYQASRQARRDRIAARKASA